MPTSYFQAIPTVLSQVILAQPTSVLDVGVGFGKYGVLLREVLELPVGRYNRTMWKTRIDGVEAFADYENPIHHFAYDHVYYGDVRVLIDSLPEYDVVLLIDVLEHFTKLEGLTLVRQLLRKARRFVLISTPLYPDTQDSYLGNQFEAHKSRWHTLDFVGFDFTYSLLPIGDGGAQIVKVYPSAGDTGADGKDELLSTRDPGANAPRSLSLVYILPHQKLTGGLKMLLQQAEVLSRRGHQVRVLLKSNEVTSAVPQWATLTQVEQHVVPPGQSLRPFIANADVIMAGWVEQLEELARYDIPVVYWEQGHEWLFGDMPLEYEPAIRRLLLHNYSQPVTLLAVSPIVSQILQARYHRRAEVVPNGIDVESFYPGAGDTEPTVLLVGNPALRFKGFDVALRALDRLWRSGFRFKVRWVCQQRPRVYTSFPLEYEENPPQERLPDIYREASVLLFASWYEGFGMPPLEAMASGVPVVTTRCGGVDSFVDPGRNAIAVEPGDVENLAAGVGQVLGDNSLRLRMAVNGRQTAQRFAWENVVPQLEEALYRVIDRLSGSARSFLRAMPAEPPAADGEG
ncbi:MAG: glycosyltransferase family 4 protein [Limnochordaceae bacterium]|nr:glycosyltransferase family 4 protein [Limnochordaceae bacterium]